MKTHKTFILILCLICGIFLLSDPVDAQIGEAEKLFEAGVYQQEAIGNFEEAIILFNRLVKEYPKERLVAAKALMRLGICYERQGSQKASEAYQQIISQYPDQLSLVNQARNRLAALSSDEPAGLSLSITRLYPPEIYLECQTLSPDATKLAGIDFHKGQNLAVYDLVSGKQKLLTNYDYNSKSIYTYTPVWSPDNMEIVHYAGCWGDSENAFTNLSITTLEGKSHVLFRNTDGGGVSPCDWFPDKSAVLAVMGNEIGLYKLVLISTKDGTSRELCQLERTFSNSDLSMAEASRIADVSPDGQLIVFVDGPKNGTQDIYTISATGSTKTFLTQHPADDSEPRWSPDGRHIVFLSNRHGSQALWGVAVHDGKADGLPFMILEGMQDTELASWTQKGLCSRTIANINDIYTLDIDPQTNKVIGKPQVLKSQAYGKSVFPQWSPDGKYLSYRSYFEADQSLNIMIKPTNGGETRRCKYDYTIRPVGGTYQWLPDGSGIGLVYWDSEYNLYFSRLDPETGDWHTRQVPTGDFKGGLLNLAWDSDGKAFFFTKAGEAGQESGIVRHDLETGKERFILLNEPGDSLSYGWWSLRISPDHKRLTLTKGENIALVDINTGKLDQIKSGEQKDLLAPTWSPDGKHLLAKGPSKAGSEINELFIISLADGKCTSLNISQYLPRGARIMTYHDWSPDGKTIVFDTRSWKSEANLIKNVITEK